MKPRLLTSIFLWLTALTGVFAQGTINVGNGITATRFPIYGSEPGAPWGYSVVGNSSLSSPTGTTIYNGGLLSGTRYKIEFWAGPASAFDFSGLSLLTTMTFRTGANPTSLPNGITDTVNLPVPGVLAGSQAKLGVRVWDTVSGSTYSTSIIRIYSQLFLSGPLSGTAPNGDQIIGTAWIGQSFSLPAIPEPSTMPLTGLGVAWLFVFRRQK